LDKVIKCIKKQTHNSVKVGEFLMKDNKLTTVSFRITQEEKEQLLQFCKDNEMTLS
jgi:hypothetical protein